MVTNFYQYFLKYFIIFYINCFFIVKIILWFLSLELLNFNPLTLFLIKSENRISTKGKVGGTKIDKISNKGTNKKQNVIIKK